MQTTQTPATRLAQQPARNQAATITHKQLTQTTERETEHLFHICPTKTEDARASGIHHAFDTSLTNRNTGDATMSDHQQATLELVHAMPAAAGETRAVRRGRHGGRSSTTVPPPASRMRWRKRWATIWGRHLCRTPATIGPANHHFTGRQTEAPREPYHQDDPSRKGQDSVAAPAPSYDDELLERLWLKVSGSSEE